MQMYREHLISNFYQHLAVQIKFTKAQEQKIINYSTQIHTEILYTNLERSPVHCINNYENFPFFMRHIMNKICKVSEIVCKP